jgi:ORF6N domain
MARTKGPDPGTVIIPAERIERSILLIRGEKLLLDRDLAVLYQVESRVLIQAVKRNIGRFRSDFMLQLSAEEQDRWRSQFVMSNPSARIGLRRWPYAFTEQGVAMLSSVHSRAELAVGNGRGDPEHLTPNGQWQCAR